MRPVWAYSEHQRIRGDMVRQVPDVFRLTARVRLGDDE